MSPHRTTLGRVIEQSSDVGRVKCIIITVKLVAQPHRSLRSKCNLSWISNANHCTQIKGKWKDTC